MRNCSAEEVALQIKFSDWILMSSNLSLLLNQACILHFHIYNAMDFSISIWEICKNTKHPTEQIKRSTHTRWTTCIERMQIYASAPHRKSKYLHRIRTLNIKLSKGLSTMFGMLICFECLRMFHFVGFSLSAVDILSTASEQFFVGFVLFCLILMYSVQSQYAIDESKTTYDCDRLFSRHCRCWLVVPLVKRWLPCEMPFLNGLGEVQNHSRLNDMFAYAFRLTLYCARCLHNVAKVNSMQIV